MPAASPGSRRVLMVDDEPTVIDVLKEFFAQFRHEHTYEIEVALNGSDGYMAFLRQRPDLVLLDMNMPGMDGLQLLKQIRALDTRVPVMMITANQDSRAAGEVHTTGIFAYVPKPFDFRHIDLLVSLALESSRAAGGPSQP